MKKEMKIVLPFYKIAYAVSFVVILSVIRAVVFTYEIGLSIEPPFAILTAVFCAKFLGADSDFGAVAEFEAVGEAGGGVDVDHRCVDFVQEFLGVGVVVGDDRLGVFCVVAVDVRDRFVNRGNRFNGYDIVEILFSPVLFCRFFCFRHVFSCLFVCAHFHMFFF